MRPKVKRIDGFEPEGHACTKVVTMGHVIETIAMARKASELPVQRLTKDTYLDKRTGEVCEYVHGETRADSLDSVRRSLEQIRALVNANVTDPECCRWVTLTYADNMTDALVLYHDFEKFWKKFCRWCKKNGTEKPEYISVIEPQGRGAWHVHAFFIWPHKAPFISNNDVLWPMWGHGFTKIKAIKDVDNIGAYFSAYLADIPLDDLAGFSQEEQSRLFGGCLVAEKEFTDDSQRTKKKQFVKGGRLRLYPAGMNLYRKSAGIVLPTVEKMTYSEAKEKVSSAKLTFSRSYAVVDDDDGSTVNVISKSYYNTKRK